MVKKALSIGMVIIMLLFLGHMSFADSPYYFKGKVASITLTSIKISVKELNVTKQFNIAPQCRVAMHIKQRGAFLERPATLRDVYIQDHVVVRVIDDTVHEILIERYKR